MNKEATIDIENPKDNDLISRQAVLDYIHRILNQGMGKKKSFEFIHKFVEKLPSVNSQPCEDEISRRAAIDAMCSACGGDCDESKFVYDAPQGERVIICPEHYALSTLPSVNPQEKTGHWIRELIRNEKGGCIGAKMICSRCNNDNKHDEYMKYCPNCGSYNGG